MVFELLDDCGRVYKLAGDFERRCFNQAIFREIRVCYDDDSGLTVNADYADPLDVILDSSMFEVKSNFERNMRNERSEMTAHVVSILDFVPEKVRTTTFFKDDGSSMDLYVRISGLYLKFIRDALRCRESVLREGLSGYNGVVEIFSQSSNGSFEVEFGVPVTVLM